MGRALRRLANLILGVAIAAGVVGVYLFVLSRGAIL
jgi:hypothetical protein